MGSIMSGYRYIILALMLWIPAGCLFSREAPVKSSQYIQTEVRDDAELLSLIVSSSLKPDPVITLRIKQMISYARSMNSELQDIRLKMPWMPQQMMLKLADDAAPLSIDNPIQTGYDGIDELNRLYQVEQIKEIAPNFYTFHFKHILNVPILVQEYQKLAGVAMVEPDQIVGDGDDIMLNRNGETWILKFKRGWGDCLAGCIHEHFWEFQFDPNGQMMGFREYGDDLPQVEKKSN